MNLFDSYASAFVVVVGLAFRQESINPMAIFMFIAFTSISLWFIAVITGFATRAKNQSAQGLHEK